MIGKWEASFCESATAPGAGSFQVIGIGINVNGEAKDFPEELRGSPRPSVRKPGTSSTATGSSLRCCTNWKCVWTNFVRGAERIALAYRRRCTTIGRTVKAVLADGKECIGVAEGINQDGSLTLVEPSGTGQLIATVRQLRAADIVHLR